MNSSPFLSTQSNLSALTIRADVHMHTHHSHGQASTEAMFRSACSKGLTIIGFSEHSPRPEGYAYPSDYQDKLKKQLPQYVQEVRELAQKSADDGITVLLGLEIDYIPGQEEFASLLSKAYPFDYVIGGLHFQKNWGFDFTADDWTPMPLEERFHAYAMYYQDLATMCETRLYHIAAHPDLIKIFTVDTFKDWLETGEAMPLIKNALSAMKENGVLMEVSSAGLRKPCREIYPCPKIMKLAADMKLPISFASDAHCENTPAHAFDQLARYAGKFGYEHSYVIIKGTPCKLPFTVPEL